MAIGRMHAGLSSVGVADVKNVGPTVVPIGRVLALVVAAAGGGSTGR